VDCPARSEHRRIAVVLRESSLPCGNNHQRMGPIVRSGSSVLAKLSRSVHPVSVTVTGDGLWSSSHSQSASFPAWRQLYSISLINTVSRGGVLVAVTVALESASRWACPRQRSPRDCRRARHAARCDRWLGKGYGGCAAGVGVRLLWLSVSTRRCLHQSSIVDVSIGAKATNIDPARMAALRAFAGARAATLRRHQAPIGQSAADRRLSPVRMWSAT